MNQQTRSDTHCIISSLLVAIGVSCKFSRKSMFSQFFRRAKIKKRKSETNHFGINLQESRLAGNVTVIRPSQTRKEEMKPEREMSYIFSFFYKKKKEELGVVADYTH